MISFKSKVTVKILNYYFLNPHAGHYVNELARLLGLDPKNLHRKLKELESEGLLRSEFRGKQRYFFLKKDSKLAKTYRDLFFRTAGFEVQLKKFLRPVKGIRDVYVFGSYAKKKMDDSSDIDLLAVGEHSVLELQKVINLLQKESGREINVVNMAGKEFDRKRKAKDPFVCNILSGKHLKLI